MRTAKKCWCVYATWPNFDTTVLMHTDFWLQGISEKIPRRSGFRLEVRVVVAAAAAVAF